MKNFSSILHSLEITHYTDLRDAIITEHCKRLITDKEPFHIQLQKQFVHRNSLYPYCNTSEKHAVIFY